MQAPAITTLHRAIAAAVAFSVMACPLTVCYWKVRAGKKRGLWVVLGSYILVMLAAFLFGALADDGFGWAFLPLMILTAPWSFFVAAPLSGMLDKWGIENWIGPLLMNFLLLAVVCGGLNMLLMCFFIRKIAHPEDRPSIT